MLYEIGRTNPSLLPTHINKALKLATRKILLTFLNTIKNQATNKTSLNHLNIVMICATSIELSKDLHQTTEPSTNTYPKGINPMSILTLMALTAITTEQVITKIRARVSLNLSTTNMIIGLITLATQAQTQGWQTSHRVQERLMGAQLLAKNTINYIAKAPQEITSLMFNPTYYQVTYLLTLYVLLTALTIVLILMPRQRCHFILLSNRRFRNTTRKLAQKNDRFAQGGNKYLPIKLLIDTCAKHRLLTEPVKEFRTHVTGGTDLPPADIK